MKREEVYEIIDGERNYQDEQWGEQTAVDGMRKPGEWLSYIYFYWSRANDANTKWVLYSDVQDQLRNPSSFSELDSNNEAMESIRKIATLCVAAMEQHGCPERELRVLKKYK